MTTEYQKLALRTESKPTSETKEHAVTNLRLQHAIWGIVTEAIELWGHTDRINLAEECGDLEWYQALARDVLGLQENFTVDVDGNFDEFSEEYASVPECVDRIIGIAGDLADIMKRFVYYMNPQSFWKLPRLLRDLDECLIQIYAFCGTDRDTVRAKNIAKLAARYPGKFDSELAINRDLVAERKVLVETASTPIGKAPDYKEQLVDAEVPTHNRPCCPVCNSRAVRPSPMNPGKHTCNNCGGHF